MEDYKGYSAKFSLDEDQGIFHGEVIGITDVVTFEGKTAEELSKAFHDSVDDYLAYCDQRGEKADKPYSGRFVLRMSPELHRAIALAAKKADLSMNEWIVASVNESLERSGSVATRHARSEWIEQLESLKRLSALYSQPTQEYGWPWQSFTPADPRRLSVPVDVNAWLLSALKALEEYKAEKPSKRVVRR